MSVIVAPSAPRFEHRTDGGDTTLGIGTGTPRISWTIADAPAGYAQTAYEVEVVRGEHITTHRVESAEQVLVPWPTSPLASRESATVRVRVGDGDRWRDWGEPAVVEAGLLEPVDWKAAFITPVGVGTEGAPAPILSSTIELPGAPRRARLYVTAHGIYVACLNGARVGDQELAPGWTSYEHRLRYQTYDVTDLLRAGQNTLEVLLGNGWYRGRLGWEGQRAVYGHELGLLAQLEVMTADGETRTLITDSTWMARESEVLADDLYDGQRTDRRRHRQGASLPQGTVRTIDASLDRLVAPDGPPVRVTDVLPAREVWTSPSGRTLVDFGQNVVGWVRLRVKASTEGDEVVVRHAEALEDGELCTRPLRSAEATDTYVLNGDPDELLEPSLTFHGFRYAEVQGVDDLATDAVEAVVIGSDLRRTGWFESSNELLDRFHENVVWGMRGNFVDIPTDCPQRDERLGWTGDIQVFAPAATFLFDTAGFLASWLADLAAEQRPDGSVPYVVPSVSDPEEAGTPAAGWGDAAAVVPWVLYQRTGDLRFIERQFASMQAWVDGISELAGPRRLWTGGFQFGDWLDPTAPPEHPGRAKADADVVATAHFARSAEIVAMAARELGRQQEADTYAGLAREVRAAFARAYVTPAGRVMSDAQTVYALAIEWALLPTEAQRHEAGLRLADLVRMSGFRISTGFVGTPLVCDALASTGHVDTAYRLLLQTECPSWLYPVTMGATTIWERWDSMRPDGSINPGAMTSFNHYALGAVVDWMHRTVAGLAPKSPGYRELLVEPRPSRALTSASARHITPYGEASVGWERSGGRLSLHVRVPVGASAHVLVPGTATAEVVGHGEHAWEVADRCEPHGGDPVIATVRDVLDDEATWVRVVTRIADSGFDAAGEAELAERLGRYLDAPASTAARALFPGNGSEVAGELREAITTLLEPSARRGEGERPGGH